MSTFVFDHGPGAHARMLQAGIPVTDAGHRHAAEHAQRADVGTLVLTHMTRQVDADGVRERVVKEIGEIYGGRVVVGEDLKTIGTEAPEIGNPL